MVGRAAAGRSDCTNRTSLTVALDSASIAHAEGPNCWNACMDRVSPPQPQFLEVASPGADAAAGRRIAYLVQSGAGHGILWLPGFKSEMVSTKASALADWAAVSGRAMTRFDYSGHGQSADGAEGRFEDGTVSRWLDETRAVFGQLTHGPQIVIGSSMGGWLALLLLRWLLVEHPAEAARIKALVLIAPAWDMTELMRQRFTDAIRQELAERGVWLRPSQYGAPYPITRGLIEDGNRHLLARRRWNPGRPVVIVHGRLDTDVPFAHSQVLCAFLYGGWTRLVDVPDGEHRLSRPEDIALLLELIAGVNGNGSGV